MGIDPVQATPSATSPISGLSARLVPAPAFDNPAFSQDGGQSQLRFCTAFRPRPPWTPLAPSSSPPFSMHPSQANPKSLSVTALEGLAHLPDGDLLPLNLGERVAALGCSPRVPAPKKLGNTILCIATTTCSGLGPQEARSPTLSPGVWRVQRVPTDSQAGSAQGPPGARGLRDGGCAVARGPGTGGRAERRAEAMLELHPERGAAGALLSWWV